MTGDPPPRIVQVVAGVIRDARGRILLTRRTEGRDLAGRWEFPGGKIDPGESAEAALARELDEELGIQVDVGAALIKVPQIYPDKRLTLDVRQITQWRGRPRGCEGQALAWVPPHKLSSYPMPPADRPVVAALLQPELYLVTPDVGPATPARGLLSPDVGPTVPAPGLLTPDVGPIMPVLGLFTPRVPTSFDPMAADSEEEWLDALDRALAQGIRRVQLRAPSADPKRWPELAATAAARCRTVGAEVLVNGDAALASSLGIGLHLRAAQLSSTTTRPLGDGARLAAQLSSATSRPVGDGVLLGASCHTIEDLRAAEALGCDFAVVGSIKPTASHPGAAGIGWDGFARLREHVSLPLYGIGGLGPEDLAEAREHGAQGIAAIRALWPTGTV